MDTFIATYRIWISRIVSLGFIALIVLTGSSHAGSVSGSLLAFIGLILVGLAVVGRLWCSLYIAGYKNQQLIRLGPYSMTRNPLYFFSFLGFTGIGLATQTLVLGLGTAAFFLVFYPYVIRHEESFLQKEFGDQFTEYCNTTPRFWPKFSLLSEPDVYQVNPKTFRRELGDVMGFILIFGLVQLINTVHQLQIIHPLALLP